MAYRFNGSSDYVQFAIAPFSGYTFTGYTVALLLLRNATGSHPFVSLQDSGGSTQITLRTSGASPQLFTSNGFANGSMGTTSTSLWYLMIATRAAGSAVGRFHVHDETSWAHVNDPSGSLGNVTIGGSDRLRVANLGGAYANCDIVCAGIKKTDSTDAAVETLSRTSFQAWRDFGFDWLVGFDSSLEAAGVLQDQGSAGTGDESSISGTSAVSDPPSWSWAAPATVVTGAAALAATGGIVAAGVVVEPIVYAEGGGVLIA